MTKQRGQRITAGRGPLSFSFVGGLFFISVICGPILYAANLYYKTPWMTIAAGLCLATVFTIHTVKSRTIHFPLLRVPGNDACCVSCGRKNALYVENMQYHLLDVKDVPPEFEFMDGIINDYEHAGTGLVSLCRVCLVKAQLDPLWRIGSCTVVIVTLSLLPITPILPYADIFVRGLAMYVIAWYGMGRILYIFPWRKNAEEVALQLVEQTVAEEHPSWVARGDKDYRGMQHRDEISPPVDDDDQLLPIAMRLTAAHLIVTLIWTGLTVLELKVWLQQ